MLNRVLLIPILMLWAAPCVADSDFDIQAAIDANPGGAVTVPHGEHFIDAPLVIREDGTVLMGSGTIVQRNPDAHILLVEGADDVRVSGLHFTRAPGAEEATVGGMEIRRSRGVVLEGIRVTECRSRQAAVAIRDSSHCTIRDSEIRNYKRIAVDDRTADPLLGYAFHAIDGTGIQVARGTHIAIRGNTVIDDQLLPTREVKEAHRLGELTEGTHATELGDLGRAAVQDGYVSNWHQGSAILVTSPRDTRHVQVTGNHIVNAAQGIDLHCDFAMVSGNVIDHCMIGIKATHGCEGLNITGNTITHVDVWGILLNPGTTSSEDNPDRAILIANNTILAYGHGHEYWNWGGANVRAENSYAIALFDGQLPENPPLREVLITGNVVGGNIGPPRYRHALTVRSWHGPPEESPNLTEAPRIVGNLFAPGVDGVANFPLDDE